MNEQYIELDTDDFLSLTKITEEVKETIKNTHGFESLCKREKPSNWLCSRRDGHLGPCAAYYTGYENQQ